MKNLTNVIQKNPSIVLINKISISQAYNQKLKAKSKLLL